MTQETYAVRGTEVTLTPIEGVVAVELAEQRDAEDVPEQTAEKLEFGTLATELYQTRGVDTFADAGFLFVRPNEEVQRSLDDQRYPSGAAFVGRALREEDGSVVVETNRLTVRFDPSLADDDCRAILDEYDLEVASELGFRPNLYEARVGPGDRAIDVARRLAERDDVEYAEPELISQIEQREAAAVSPVQPNDPQYDQQWQWQTVHAEHAWGHTTGEGTTVAVVDNGFDVSHDDVEPALATGTGFFERTAGGGADLVVGTGAYPDNNHGTFCAGMAAGVGDNGTGICGAAYGADLLLVACLNDQVGTQATLARAVAYAANPAVERAGRDAGLTEDDGADVVSCSLGPNDARWVMQSVLKDAIDFAVESGRPSDPDPLGTPVFWAASNGDVDVGEDQVSSYENTVAVGRSTKTDTDHGSAHGPELDLLAPGVDVRSTMSGNVYGVSTGTSFAAPLSAGVAALVLAVDPGLDWVDALWTILDTCEQVGGVDYGDDDHHERYGFGRIDARGAVAAAAGEAGTTEPAPTPVTGGPTIEGPDTASFPGPPPTFAVDPGVNDFFVVEVATRAELFDFDAHGDERSVENFYPHWDVEDPPKETGTSYTLPVDVWERLQATSPEALFYRVHTSANADDWTNWFVSTPPGQPTQADSVRLVRDRGGLLEGSVGSGGENRPEDVRALRGRLVELGFDWLDVTAEVDEELRKTINLVQSIVRGRQQVRGDGRVDVPGQTYAWLTAENAPRWRELPVGSKTGEAGYYNFQVAEQPGDDHSYGTDWLVDTIEAAGQVYQDSYRRSNPDAAPLTVNDASPRHGGDTSDHAGHETGLSFDMRLPRTDGDAGRITFDSDVYDREAMAAMLSALRNRPLVEFVLFNDPELIDRGLCTDAPGHDNHAHVEIRPPARRGGDERGVEESEPGRAIEGYGR